MASTGTSQALGGVGVRLLTMDTTPTSRLAVSRLGVGWVLLRPLAGPREAVKVPPGTGQLLPPLTKDRPVGVSGEPRWKPPPQVGPTRGGDARAATSAPRLPSGPLQPSFWE